MTFQIIITPNEISLINEFKKHNIDFIINNLLIGDIHIKNDHHIFIFERKAKNDLDASIKDGRYHEQKERILKTNINKNNIYYIIENLKYNTSNSKRIWSSITNTIVRDNLNIINTKNIEETVIFLNSFLESLNKFKNTNNVYENNNEVKNDIINLNIKKSKIKIEDWLKYSLTLIPKCSLNISTKIIEKYNTLELLKEEIKNNGIYCFSNITHGKSKRKIGNKLSQIISETLLKHF